MPCGPPGLHLISEDSAYEVAEPSKSKLLRQFCVNGKAHKLQRCPTAIRYLFVSDIRSAQLNDSESSSLKKAPINDSRLKYSLLLRGSNCLLRRNAVIVCNPLAEEALMGAIALMDKHVNKIRVVKRQ